jgi:GT2 family glycosyltransferase
MKNNLNQKLNVTVVVPNYDGYDLLKKNLPAVMKAKNYIKNNIIEVIVVDDKSKDKSVELLKKDFAEVRIIKHKENRGFSASVNTGARSAEGRFICLLNTDVVPEKNFLVSALKYFENTNIFAVSLHEQGFGWAKGNFEKGFIVHEPGKENEAVHESFWASGGSAVFRRNIWMKLGGMDEDLFKFYWEDVDLSYRAQKRGYKILWDPNARVIHKHESVTSVRFSKRQLSQMQETNQLVFIWKNLTSVNLFRKHIAGLVQRITKNPGYLVIVFRALGKISEVRKKRKKEKKESKISDEAIFAKFK